MIGREKDNVVSFEQYKNKLAETFPDDDPPMLCDEDFDVFDQMTEEELGEVLQEIIDMYGGIPEEWIDDAYIPANDLFPSPELFSESHKNDFQIIFIDKDGTTWDLSEGAEGLDFSVE